VDGAIVISGVGTVSAFGVGFDALAEGLAGGKPVTREVDRSEGFHRASSPLRAALVTGVPLSAWLPPLMSRRMSPPSRYAVVAARCALAEAGFAPAEQRDPSVSVCLASAFGPTSYTQRLLDQMLDEGPESVSPFLFAECVANAPAAQVAIDAKASGPNHTLCAQEAGALIAVAHGAGEIRGGRARLALVGAAEEMTPLLHALLDRFGALARDEARARPFDRRRDGMLAAEGATVLVLESEKDTLARGARRVARLRAWGSAFDPTATRTDWGNGGALLGRALARGLDRFGVALDEIDAVVSGASGSRGGDRVEAHMLAAAWDGKALPPVLAPKELTGEYGGTFLGAAVLAALGRGVTPLDTAFEVDPDLGLRPRRGVMPEDARRVLVTSTASGGAAAWLVLERT